MPPPPSPSTHADGTHADGELPGSGWCSHRSTTEGLGTRERIAQLNVRQPCAGSAIDAAATVGVFVADRFGTGRFDVDLRDPFGHQEPPDRLVDAPADREQTVAPQDDEPRVTQRGGDPLATIGRLDVDLTVHEDLVVTVEGDGFLADRTEWLRHRRPGCAVRRVRVRRADDIGSSFVDRHVDVVRRRVDLAAARDHRTVGTDEHEVADRRLAERHAIPEQPETVGALRVACRDVTIALFAPMHRSEQSVGECEPTTAADTELFEVVDLGLDVGGMERRVRVHTVSVRDGTTGILGPMTTPTMLRRVLPALMVALGALLLAPATANAHTDFDYSLPTDGASVGEPLDEVTVAFTLPVTLVGNGFAVLDPQNNELAPFAVTDDDTVFRLQFDPPLAGGTVAVRYEVRAEDGHVLAGSFVFAVDAPVPTTAPPTTTAPSTAAPVDSAPEVAVTTTAPTATTSIAPAGSEAPTTSVAATPATVEAVAVAVAVADAAGDDDGGGAGVYIAIAAAVVLGAGGFLLVRSRTSGHA